MKSCFARPALIALPFFAAAPRVSAQDNEIAELKAMVAAMQQTIAEQNERIATLEKRQAAQTAGRADEAVERPAASSPRRPQAAAPAIAAAEPPLPETSAAVVAVDPGPMRDADTFADLQRAAPRANNAPLDPKLKGFIPIPGTETMFKIGGSARVDTILDLENNGNPNQFVPSTIPVPGQAGWNGGQRTSFHTKGTRLNLELRRPVAYDDTLRIYSEYDFFDDSTSNSMKFRTRHFYGQAWNFLIGQTFSAFMDVDAFPDVVDYQGPNGILNRRQPQIRYTHPIAEGECSTQFFVSLEQPDSKIDTGTAEFTAPSSAVNHGPDGVLGFRWEGPQGHLQSAAIFRSLSFESDSGPSEDTVGWGLSLSGSLNVSEKDKFSAQVSYGEGIARYVNDLSGENLDAAFVAGDLEPIPVFAAMAGYTHHWNDHWRSTVAGGFVQVDAPGSLGRFAIDRTLYGSANLMWHPTPSFRTGLEYLYGNKETLDGSERDAHRFNFVIRYDLVR
jgi:hypothetical protein